MSTSTVSRLQSHSPVLDIVPAADVAAAGRCVLAGYRWGDDGVELGVKRAIDKGRRGADALPMWMTLARASLVLIGLLPSSTAGQSSICLTEAARTSAIRIIRTTA